MHSARLLFLLLASFSHVACFPFVVPPARLSVGPAIRQGDIGDSAGNTENDHLVAFRGGLHPLGGTKAGDRRAFDLGIGYAVEGPNEHDNQNGTRAAVIHGPYVEAGAYPLRFALSEKYALRAGVNGTLDALVREGAPDAGLGLSAGPLVEVTGNATGPFTSDTEDGFSTGVASGYWAFGLYGNAAYRRFEEHTSRAFSVGISLRIPFAFGIACCAWPHSSSDNDGSTSPSASNASSRPTRNRATPKPAK